jgi:hypothetical protein
MFNLSKLPRLKAVRLSIRNRTWAFPAILRTLPDINSVEQVEVVILSRIDLPSWDSLWAPALAELDHHNMHTRFAQVQCFLITSHPFGLQENEGVALARVMPLTHARGMLQHKLPYQDH